MIIRNAVENDLMSIVSMARKFYDTTSYRAFAPMSSDAVRTCALTAMRTGTMLVVEGETKLVGMICLLVVPFMFNPSIKSADEVVWWIDQEAQGQGAGIALLKAVDEPCRAAGADIVRMMLLHDSPARARELYESLGYVHSESSFTKRL